MMDVLKEFEKVAISVAEDGFIPPLEQMSDGSVLFVKVHSIALVDALEDLGEWSITRFNQKMDVVSHEDVGIEAEGVALFVAGEECEIFVEVTCALEDLLLLVSARDYMVESSFVFYGVLACHAARIAEPESPVNNSIFKSDPILLLFGKKVFIL
jgi:hypothetical protein